MNKLLPHPLLTLVLLFVWLLLVNSVAFGHWLLGGVLGVVIAWLVHPFWPDRPQLAHAGTLTRLLARLLFDIVVANLTVARQVLGPVKQLKPGFFEYPLALHDPYAISMLANLISLTPGTVTADVSEDRKRLYIHALNLRDESETVAHIRRHYEAPLKEIFEC